MPLIALLLFIFVVKDFGPYADRDNRHSLGQMWKSVRGQPQVWLVAAVGFFLNTSIMSLNGLWATPFLVVSSAGYDQPTPDDLHRTGSVSPPLRRG